MEVTGKYTNAKIFTDIIEPDAIKQIQFLCNHPLFENKKIRIMPDVHPSKASVVGLVAEIDPDHIIPQLLGTDIGCTVSVYKVRGNTLKDYDKLDKVIRNLNVKWNPGLNHPIAVFKKKFNLNTSYSKEYGSIGGGNHFISLERAGEDICLIIHSGSRSLGKDVAIEYSKLALEQNPYKGGEEKQLSWLNEESSIDYLRDAVTCLQYATYNQQDIVDAICKEMKWKSELVVRCPHNYIDLNRTILHKGSISMESKIGIVPLNMAEGSLIIQLNVVPVELFEDWLFSAPHGAGRLLKRSECTEKLNMQDFKDVMKGIHCSNVSTSTLDESPMAYKPWLQVYVPMQEIYNVKEYTEVLYNYKG